MPKAEDEEDDEDYDDKERTTAYSNRVEEERKKQESSLRWTCHDHSRNMTKSAEVRKRREEAGKRRKAQKEEEESKVWEEERQKMQALQVDDEPHLLSLTKIGSFSLFLLTIWRHLSDHNIGL